MYETFTSAYTILCTFTQLDIRPYEMKCHKSRKNPNAATYLIKSTYSNEYFAETTSNEPAFTKADKKKRLLGKTNK